MARYFTRGPSLWIEDDVDYGEENPAVPVVCDHQAVDTGLIDVGGNSIMRAPNPIGFGREDEW